MSDVQIYPIRESYIKKFPELHRMVNERLGVKCYGLRVLDDFEGVMLVTKGVVYHIHVKPESRHSGIGSELLRYAVNHYKDDNGELKAAVRPDDVNAVCMFIKEGFQVRGFEVTWGDNRYNMIYGGVYRTFNGIDPWEDAIQQLEELADYLYVVELDSVRL